MAATAPAPLARLISATDTAPALNNAKPTMKNADFLSELLQGSTKLPERFIEVDQDQRLQVIENPELDIPVFDLAVLSTGDKKQRKDFVDAVAMACQTWGFFQVSNHGVDKSLIDRCEAEAHRMFELPLEVKERVHRPPGATFGYGANTWVNQTVMHWAESFHMQLKPTSNIREMAAKLFATVGDSVQFSSAIENYMIAVEVLARQVLELLTEGLGLEPGCFNQYSESEHMTSMRFNFYPPCPEPSRAIGLRAHTDPHLLTILHQDKIPGLQVKVQDNWITVKPREDCLVVNVGDLFQIVSNTRYKSVIHRAFVNSTSKRLSLACFFNPPLNSTVIAPPELITADWPQVYRPFTWFEYLKNAYTNHPSKSGDDRHERFYLKSLDIPPPASSVH